MQNRYPLGANLLKAANPIEQGLDYLLEHLEGKVWPRTIHTHLTQRPWQVVVYSREQALAMLNQANWLDCRISAYPKLLKWESFLHPQAPNFIFIDLDENNSRQDLEKTLRNIQITFRSNVEPTVLWSGRGYHIYLPVEGISLESESVFADFNFEDKIEPSRRFIQWVEQYLSNRKADKNHSKGVSFKNCMLRLPASINSKNGETVKIIQNWNGVRPSIKPLLFDFYIHLADLKLKEIQGVKPAFSKNTWQYWRSKN